MHDENLLGVTLIPKYGCEEKVIQAIDEIAFYPGNYSAFIGAHILGEDNCCENKKDQIVPVAAEISAGRINKIGKIADSLDLVVVHSQFSGRLEDSFEEKAVSYDIAGEYRSKMNGIHSAAFFSNTAEPFERKVMTGKDNIPKQSSDATYHWKIERPEHPSNGDVPVVLLLQFIPPYGKTSDHYHKKTVETYIPILGKAFWTLHKNSEYGRGFEQVMPGTFHQLYTREEPAINVLCMNPFDPGLEDHFFE